jgi:hypothetical protein
MDKKYWEEAAAELMAGIDSKRKEIDSIVAKLNNEDAEVRAYALCQLAEYGNDAILVFLNALDHDLPEVRRAARGYFFAFFPDHVFSAELRQLLESRHSKTRLEGIRKLVTLLLPVQAAILGRNVGWQHLVQWLPKRDTVRESQRDPQKVKEEAVEKVQGRKGKKSATANSRSPSEDSPVWKEHLDSYQEIKLLCFADDKELDRAIDLLWTDDLRFLPHDTPDGRSIAIPAEAVELFRRAGLKFLTRNLRSINDLNHKEIEKLRR